MRALEQHAQRPLFNDPLAARMLSGWPAVVVARLRDHGLTPQTDIGADDHQARLLQGGGRKLAVFPGERIAVAAKEG